jgi:hypothetical protein
MADARQEWLKLITDILAAGAGVDLNGQSDVLPYSPSMLEGMANSEKE